MRTMTFAGVVSVLLSVNTSLADVPSVTADILPVHSLVAMVMKGVGVPDLIVRPGASPHAYALWPSMAATLQRSDLVFWVGDPLTPWLVKPLATLARGAKRVALITAERTRLRPFRKGPTFESGNYSEDKVDPHAWLDPENARLWLDVIALNLAELDPEHAAVYASNAAAGKAALDDLIHEISEKLLPYQGVNYIVFHDSYQYFENRFEIPAAGSLRLSDAADPSPARISRIRDKVTELGIKCAFSEPQFNSGLIHAVFRGTEAKIGVLDPLGTKLRPGPALYPALLRNLAQGLSRCLRYSIEPEMIRTNP